LHPSEVENKVVLLWQRSREFFEKYQGKRVICGHTATENLPDLSTYTPDDKTDLWFRGDVVAVDTRCGKEGGFLTAIELPSLAIYESRCRAVRLDRNPLAARNLFQGTSRDRARTVRADLHDHARYHWRFARPLGKGVRLLLFVVGVAHGALF
jgi:hypothetical protein